MNRKAKEIKSQSITYVGCFQEHRKAEKKKFEDQKSRIENDFKFNFFSWRIELNNNDNDNLKLCYKKIFRNWKLKQIILTGDAKGLV